jgi:hypothetical protein
MVRRLENTFPAEGRRRYPDQGQSGAASRRDDRCTLDVEASARTTGTEEERGPGARRSAFGGDARTDAIHVGTSDSAGPGGNENTDRGACPAAFGAARHDSEPGAAYTGSCTAGDTRIIF